MKMPEKERMVRFYEDLYDKYGDDTRSLDWKDPEGQKARYDVLFSLIEMMGPKPGFSLADIGCGLGHFYEYLKKRKLPEKWKIDYAGYDINPKLIEGASKKFPEVKFAVRDILDGYFTEKFDFIVSCGVFNIRFAGIEEHEAFVREMLLRMYEGCNVGLAVNFLSANGIYYVPGGGRNEESIYYYFKPEEIVRYVRSVTGRFDLRHDYHSGDFTVYLFKE